MKPFKSLVALATIPILVYVAGSMVYFRYIREGEVAERIASFAAYSTSVFVLAILLVLLIALIIANDYVMESRNARNNDSTSTPTPGPSAD